MVFEFVERIKDWIVETRCPSFKGLMMLFWGLWMDGGREGGREYLEETEGSIGFQDSCFRTINFKRNFRRC